MSVSVVKPYIQKRATVTYILTTENISIFIYLVEQRYTDLCICSLYTDSPAVYVSSSFQCVSAHKVKDYTALGLLQTPNRH